MAKDWLKRARKATPEEIKQMSAASGTAGISEQEAEILSDPSMAVDMVTGAAEGIKDFATVLPQETSMETLDELIELLGGEEAAKAYMAEIKAARERSPVSTAAATLAAPNPLQKAGLAAKVAKKIPVAGKYLRKGLATDVGADAATAAAVQLGTEGQVTPDMVAANVLGGKVLRSAGGALFNDMAKRRASHLNLGDITRYDKSARNAIRAGEYRDIEDEARLLIDRLDRYGILEPMAGKFDARAARFKGNRPQKGSNIEMLRRVKKGLSHRELLKRIRTSKEQVAKQLDKQLDAYTVEKPIGGVLEYDSPEGLVSAVDVSEFRDNMIETIRNTPTVDPSEANAVNNMIENSMDRLFGTERDLYANIKDINEEKKLLYQVLDDYYQDKGVSTTKKSAVAMLANLYKTKVDDLAQGNSTIKRYNEYLGDMASIEEGVVQRIGGRFASKDTTGFKPYGTTAYQAGSMLETKKDEILTPLNEMARYIQQDPALANKIKGRAAKVLPRIFTDEQSPSEGFFSNLQAAEAQMESIPEMLIKTKIPRTTEGILQNKKLFLAKIAQQSPENFDQFKYILDNRPEDIRAALPMLIEIAPEMFENDRYNRIDGIVPMDKIPMATEEIRKDPALSNKERIYKLDLLNRTGEYK